MTNNRNRYWTSEPPVDDLEKIQEYIKPSGGGELFGVLESSSVPPNELYAASERPLSPPTGPSIFEEIGVEKEEFVELALQQPELWDDGELGEIMDSFVTDTNTERFESLARDFFTGYKTAPVKPPEPPKRQTAEEIREELGLEGEDIELEPDLLSMSIDDMDKPKDAIDVGDWWINKDKKQ